MRVCEFAKSSLPVRLRQESDASRINGGCKKLLALERSCDRLPTVRGPTVLISGFHELQQWEDRESYSGGRAVWASYS